MQLGVAGTLRREFAGRSDAAVFRRFQQMQNDARKRRDREDDIERDGSELLDMVALVVTETELRESRLQLDRYDAATIEALYANEAELAKVREELDRLLARAHVLPDGRRVFKTEDGTRVFDEYGNEVDDDVVHADEIGDEKPRWEEFEVLQAERDALERERQEILVYQAKLDEARERLDAGDLTREEFDRLRDDLTTDMPDAVREHIPELANEQPEPTPDTQASAQETALVIDDDMVPSSFAPPASTPSPGG